MNCPDITRSDGLLVQQIQTDIGCVPNDPLLFVQKFYGVGLGIIGGVGLIVIMYGAYLLMTSSGNVSQIEKGKGFILYAIVGICLAVFGFVFLQFVAVDIFHIPSFGA